MRSLLYQLLVLLITLGLLFFSTNLSFGQVLSLKSNSIIEKRILRGQEQEVQVTITRGSLQWQQSDNGIDWQNWSGQTSSSIKLTVNSQVFLRCAITEANCDEIYSDVLKLIPYELPGVVTASITDITPNSALGGGAITGNNVALIIARGICWATQPNPTTANNKTNDGNAVGVFNSRLTGLTSKTFYYVRAYATNSDGTFYGNQISFTTLGNISLPTVTTNEISGVTQATATCGGNVTNDGGGVVTSKGVSWKFSNDLTSTDSKTVDGSGTGTFASNLFSLKANTTYYVRAYAINGAGVAYGDERIFTSCKENTDCNVVSSCNVISFAHLAIKQLDLSNPNYKTLNDLLLKIDKTNAYQIFTRDPSDFLMWCLLLSPSNITNWITVLSSRHETNHQINRSLRQCSSNHTGSYLFLGNVYSTELESGQTANYGIVSETIPDLLKTHDRYNIYIVQAASANGNDLIILLDEFNAYTGDAGLVPKYFKSGVLPSNGGSITNAGIDGMLNFMVWFEYYLKSARLNHPQTYAIIKAQAETLKYIQTLWSKAEEALVEGYAFTTISGTSSTYRMMFSQDYFNAAYSDQMLSELDQLGITHKPRSFWQGTYIK